MPSPALGSKSENVRKTESRSAHYKSRGFAVTERTLWGDAQDQKFAVAEAEALCLFWSCTATFANALD